MASGAIPAITGIVLMTPEQNRLHSEIFEYQVCKLALISSLIFKQFVPLVLLPKQSINPDTTQALPGFNFASFLPETIRCHRFC